MNEYSDLKVHNLSIKRQIGEGVTPSPVCSEIQEIATLIRKNIFLFFSQLLLWTYLLLDVCNLPP